MNKILFRRIQIKICYEINIFLTNKFLSIFFSVYYSYKIYNSSNFNFLRL